MRQQRKASPFGDVADQSHAADADYAMLKLHLSLAVRRWLARSDMDWRQLERRVGNAGVSVRSIEALDTAVSIDLLARALLALGATQRDIALEIVRHT
jgi:hypothetical protein